MAEASVVFSAGALLRGEVEVLEAIRHHAVIVGGQWHEYGVGEGDIVDTRQTPLGPAPGVVIHHNFTEAILDGRSYSYVPMWLLTSLEVIFGVVAALVFAAYSGFWTKVGGFIIFSFALVLIQWLMLQLFGTFFEAFVPLLGLWLHSIFERFLDHRSTSTSQSA
jgi:CHASE2 domain-containing sensor protein